MKKYQNWLQLQKYEHHIENLTRIRQQHANKLYNSQSRLNSRSSSHCYFRKRKAHPHHNLARISNTFDINEQNFRMAKRILFVQPVISRHKHKQFYSKSRSISKKMSHHYITHENRDKCLQNFLKAQPFKNVSKMHQYVFTIKINAISKQLPFHQFSTIWLELNNGKQIKSSQFIPISQIYDHLFVFAYRNNLRSNLKLSIHHSKNLRYQKIGDFVLSTLKVNTSQTLELKSSSKKYLINKSNEKATENYCTINATISYQKIIKQKGNNSKNKRNDTQI